MSDHEDEEHEVPATPALQEISLIDDREPISVPSESVGELPPTPLHKLPDFKQKAIKTAIFCYSFVMLGITISCLGPTLPQLARNAHVDVQAMGWVFTGTH
jgi:hypothetical protein